MFGLFALLPCKFFVSRGLQSKRHCAMRLRCLFSEYIYALLLV